MSGFVPVQFTKVGKIVLVIGIILLLVKLVSYATDWFHLPICLLYFGGGSMIIGLYLIFVVPKE